MRPAEGLPPGSPRWVGSLSGWCPFWCHISWVCKCLWASHPLIVRSDDPSGLLHLAFCVCIGRPPLSSFDDFETPISQKYLSHLIEDSLYNSLLSSAPNTRHRALALSSSLPHAGDWLSVLPPPTWVYISLALNSGLVCSTGLESLSLILALTAPSAFDPLTLSVTMQWRVVGMEIESPDTTILGKSSTQLLNQLSFPLVGRSHHWCLALSPVPLTSSSPISPWVSLPP